MINKEQYKEILDICTKYTESYVKMFPDKPMSSDYVEGFTRAIDLVETLVEK